MKKIGVVLIISGLLLGSIPWIGNTYMGIKREQLYRSYLKQLDEPNQLPKEENAALISEMPKQVPSDEKKQDTKKDYSFSEDDVIGTIKIPRIALDLLMIEGESKSNLRLGATHMIGTAYPGESGNCVIAGHRNYTFGSMFNRLGEMQLNDEMIIEFEQQEYRYKIDEIEVVNPDDLTVLEQPIGEKRITLLTCHPVHIGNKRLLIKGKLLVSPDI